MVKATSGEAFGYGYGATRGGGFSRIRHYAKALRITFDEKDRVLDFEFETSGKK